MAEATLITGCSSGIGRALAEEFHRRGHLVCATARRVETLEQLEGRGIRTAALDVNDPAAIDALVGRLEDDDVTIGTLVNNAGYGAMGPVAELPLDELRLQFETNVFGVVALIRAVVPGMAENPRPLVRIGRGSRLLPFLRRWLPTRLLDRTLSRRFGLNRLGRGGAQPDR